MSKERPILFSASMVRALLDGTKTQTRRVCKPAEAHGLSFVIEVPDPLERGQVYNGSHFGNEEGGVQFASPYGGVGDRLWVREAHAFSVIDPEGLDWHDDPENWDVIYRADARQPGGGWRDAAGKVIGAPWRPSIHMPRWASRIDLEVTGVRVERLQDISEADAEAEGCERLDSERDEHDWQLCPQCGGTRLYTAFGPKLGAMPDSDCGRCDSYVKRYQHLWTAINGADSWDLNPWVWVVDFRRVRP